MLSRDKRLTRRKIQTARKAAAIQDAMVHANTLMAEGLLSPAEFNGMLADAKARRLTLEARRAPAYPMRKEDRCYA